VVILYEIDIDAGMLLETIPIKTFEKEATRITEYFWFNDFDVWDGGVD
jgi:hypothetical protein